MNLPIVDFQTAKDLKELGFDWNIPNKYADNGQLNDVTYSGDIKAPTQSEVCKWLRDEKSIFITIMFEMDGWHVYYDVGKNVGSEALNEEFNTYEAAELAGIKKAIEILKEYDYE